MKPIDAYNDTATRARAFIRLYDGLINTRKRSIRADWKKSFCELMHWPQSADLDRVDSRDAVVVLRDGSNLTPDDFSKETLEDLLRASVTYGVSALDRYVHERVVKGFVSAYKNGSLTKQQKDFQMPVTLALGIAQNMHEARKKEITTRPANEVRKAVQMTLHKRPFQSWREVEFGFRLLGCKDLGKAIREACGLDSSTADKIKSDLNRIVARRNRIVHEGDLSRHQRGGGVTIQDIQRKWVVDSLDFLDGFVSKLEQI